MEKSSSKDVSRLSEKEQVEPPKSHSLVITHTESPDAIFVRRKSLDNSWEKFNLYIQKILSSREDYGLHQVREGDSVGVCDEGHYFRGIVSGIKNREYAIFLLDKGPTIYTSKRYLIPLPRELTRTRAFCVRVKLAGLIPLGTADQSWSATAKESFCTFMQNIREVEGYLAGEVDKDKKQIEIDLTFTKSVVEHAFKPPVVQTISVKKFLHENGFAMLKKQSELSIEAAKSTNFMLLNCGSEEGQIEQNDALLPEDDLSIKGQANWNQGPIKPMWPSPVMTEERVFDAKVTFIDSEGQIYVQTKEQQEMADDLNQTLVSFVKNLDEFDHALEQEKVWNDGDIGIAPYPEPDIAPGWFRFALIKVNAENDNEASVCFVDYGEHKEIDLRTAISRFPLKAMEIPILALRCKLSKIVPIDNYYETEFLDAVHSEIVEKDVIVKVAKKGQTFPIPAVIKLLLKDNLELNLARDFKNRGKAMYATDELWYDANAIRRQEKVALYIQPRVAPSDPQNP